MINTSEFLVLHRGLDLGLVFVAVTDQPEMEVWEIFINKREYTLEISLTTTETD
jgi:hypothetical protein